MQIMTAAILQASGGFGTFLVPLALMFGIMYLMGDLRIGITYRHFEDRLYELG